MKYLAILKERSESLKEYTNFQCYVEFRHWLGVFLTGAELSVVEASECDEMLVNIPVNSMKAFCPVVIGLFVNIPPVDPFNA